MDYKRKLPVDTYRGIINYYRYYIEDINKYVPSDHLITIDDFSRIVKNHDALESILYYFMLTYDDYETEINEVEVSRGRDFVKEQERRKKEKRFLDSHEEKEVKIRFKMFKKGKGFGGPITTELGHGIITVIVNASPDGMILLRKRQAYFFYDIYKNRYSLFKMMGEKKKFEWPKEEVA